MAATAELTSTSTDRAIGVTGCTSPYGSPFTPAGRLCEHRPSMCFACPNAIVGEFRRGRAGRHSLENSLEGTVGQSLDLFHRYEVFIQAELYFRIVHSLLSSETDFAQVREVHSHPQPLAQ